VADTIKEEAAEAVGRFRAAGITPMMITGDNPRTAAAVADQVGITDFFADVLPREKASHVRRLQNQERRVMMVGDGINDAPALTQADIGVAIGAGTDIAIESADIVIMNERLTSVVDAYEIGVSSYRKTKQNLALAFSFNTAGVAAAVTGLVSPVWAMIAMITSVTAVLANSFGGQLLRGQLPTTQYSIPTDDHHTVDGEAPPGEIGAYEEEAESSGLDTVLDGHPVRFWIGVSGAITAAVVVLGLLFG
ncbi:MAG: HAD-IC family P-type ATPase, partial [Acidimicrobiia bacterium]